MSFSKKYLQKYGWEEGQGLGKDKTGIKKALLLKIKLDKLGIGCSPAIDFTDHWWGNVYNEALANLKYESNASSELDPNSFVKSEKRKKSKLKNNQEQDTKVPWNLDELYKACAGRTAHKGARHGLQLSGKLQRLQQQEQALLTANTIPNGKLRDSDSSFICHEESSSEGSCRKKRKRYSQIK